MVNREYIKTQIDILPESVVESINKYIAKFKRNSEYTAMLERSFKQSEEGKTVTFEIEELISMETLSQEGVRALIEKAKARGGSTKGK